MRESFTSRGNGTPSISGDRKRTKPKRQNQLNTKMWPKPETILRAQNKKPTGQHQLYLITSSFPRCNAADQSCSDFQQNKQRQRPSYAHASAPLANEKHKGERELRTSTGHQSTQHHGNSLQTSPPNLPPIAFRSLTNDSNYSTNPRFHGLASVE